MDLLEPFGTGIYLSASYFDHSCQPNARVVFDGREAMVMATKDIYSSENEPTTSSQISTSAHDYLSSRVINEWNFYLLKSVFSGFRNWLFPDL